MIISKFDFSGVTPNKFKAWFEFDNFNYWLKIIPLSDLFIAQEVLYEAQITWGNLYTKKIVAPMRPKNILSLKNHSQFNQKLLYHKIS